MLNLLRLCSLFFWLIISAVAASDPATTSWWRFHGNQKSTGQSTINGPQAGILKWKYRVGSWMGSPSLAPDGTVYFTTDKSELLALNPEGKLKWRYQFPPTSPPPNLDAVESKEWLEIGAGGTFATHCPAIAPDGTIYFGVTFHPNKVPSGAKLGLYAIAPNGQRKWFFETGEEVTSSPNIAKDGSVYFTTTKALYCLTSSGALKWSFPRDGQQVKWSNPSLNEEGNVYVVGKTLDAISPAGKKLWSYSPQEGVIKGFVAHPVLGVGGMICFATGQTMYAVNSDGSEKWSRRLGWSESAPAIASNGTIYIGTGVSEEGGAGKFNALNPANGTTLWTFPILTAVDSSAAIGRDGTIYFGSDDGLFYALNSQGELKWKFDIGVNPGKYGEIDTSPAIGADGTIYFGHAGGPGEKQGGLFFYAVSDR